MKARAWWLAGVVAGCVAGGAALAADPHEDERAATEASQQGDFGTAVRLLTGALAAPGLSAEERAELTLHRAFAYDEDGQYDRAIADYTQVIAQKPDASQVYFRRGISRREKGEYEQALADFDVAMGESAPEVPFVYGDRGVVRFALGRFAEAARDFAHVVALDPTDQYAVLWLHVARSRAGRTDGEEFAHDAAESASQVWPRPLVALYLGDGSPQWVRDAAAEGDTEAHQNKECEADFFLGEYALLRGQADTAKPLFRSVVESCSPSLGVHAGAAGELKRLGG